MISDVVLSVVDLYKKTYLFNVVAYRLTLQFDGIHISNDPVGQVFAFLNHFFRTPYIKVLCWGNRLLIKFKHIHGDVENVAIISYAKLASAFTHASQRAPAGFIAGALYRLKIMPFIQIFTLTLPYFISIAFAHFLCICKIQCHLVMHGPVLIYLCFPTVGKQVLNGLRFG